jgi:hypothetical protein
MPYRPGKPTRYGSTAAALVECSVKVSPTLARLIRKSAENEPSNASATDALLMAAGIRPGEISRLRNALERALDESNNGARRPPSHVIRSRKQRSLLRTGIRKERSFAEIFVRQPNR